MKSDLLMTLPAFITRCALTGWPRPPPPISSGRFHMGPSQLRPRLMPLHGPMPLRRHKLSWRSWRRC